MSDSAEAPPDAGRADAAAPAARRSITAAELRGHAIRAHKEGRLDEAFAAYRAYLRGRPRDSGVWTNLGALLRKRGQHDAAAAAQRRALALAPEDVSILSNLGNALGDADRLEEALEIRRRVLAIRPEDPDAHAML
ncbi:MAG: tetratricopeptide repeat protein, partial [Pseudomonadota bacterium]